MDVQVARSSIIDKVIGLAAIHTMSKTRDYRLIGVDGRAAIAAGLAGAQWYKPAIKHDLPKPYTSTIEAFCEIIPTLIRQLRDPEYFVRRPLPSPTAP
jgi:hypothetical protein